MRIVITAAQVPFVRGGSELLVDSLATELRARGHAVEVVQLPYKWYPARAVLSQALAWRLLDIGESQGQPIDLVIATKFPSYLVRHPNKVTWLFHQFRQAYDLFDSAFNELTDTAEDRRIRQLIQSMDTRLLAESRAIYAIAGNVSKRLLRYNGLQSVPLYPPPPLGERYRCEEYGGFVLSVGRLESIKRVDLLLRAMQHVQGGLHCVVAGTGPEAERLQAQASELGVAPRVEFRGYVDEATLLELYARCRAVFYAPYDEDYGFVTLEAFRSRKPVVTTSDAGGVLEFVTHGETGLVCEPEPAAAARLLDQLAGDEALCRRLGEAGCRRVADISWETVIERLLAAGEVETG